MTLEILILEVGKTYQAHELNGFANSERLHDIQYFTYISFEPNSIPRKISQHYEVTTDVHYLARENLSGPRTTFVEPQTAEGGGASERLEVPSSKPQADHLRGKERMFQTETEKPRDVCGAGGYDNNGPAKSVKETISPRSGMASVEKVSHTSQEGRYFSIVRIYDCTNGPFKSVERMEFKKEGALSLVDRFRMAEGCIVRGYN